MMGALHTWGRDLSYHPHVHYLVPADGITDDNRTWLSTAHNFLVPVKALSILFRAKFREALAKAGLLDGVDARTWDKDWVVHSQSVGKGEDALKYLAPYIFRIAISNKRILKVADKQVTFAYRASDTGKWRRMALSIDHFLQRFLQHVLPKGFVKVRYYGLFSPSKRHLLPTIQLILGKVQPIVQTTEQTNASTAIACPTCGQPMPWVCEVRPRARCPPKAS